MARMFFINLPVADLPRAMTFYEAIGATNDPRFTDETAAAMTFSETVHVMLLTHEKWRQFTDRKIADGLTTSEVAIAFSCDNREEVNDVTAIAAAHGGRADVNPPQDHGFMFSRSFTDPDGHVWEPVWMDMAAFAQMQGEAADA